MEGEAATSIAEYRTVGDFVQNYDPVSAPGFITGSVKFTVGPPHAASASLKASILDKN